MDKAIYWLKKAANNGDKQSAGNLSYIYVDGVNGVKINKEKSFHWMLKAAYSNKFYKGDISDFFSLAKYYEKGIGTEKDLVQAYKCYMLSGSAGSEGKHRVAKRMTSDQIKEGKRLAKEWMNENNTYVPSY